MPGRFTAVAVEELIRTLTEIRDRCLAMEQDFSAEIARVTPDYQASARNLLHYLSLRQTDLRDLQRGLTLFGLSSLGRTEAHTLAGVDAVLAALHRLSGTDMRRTPEQVPPVDFRTGPELLARHAGETLGPEPDGRAVRIMVTMPSEAATDFELVRDLVDAGMNIMRINCAHDAQPSWLGMIENLRRATAGRPERCRVLCDLAGPKLRTGALRPGARVIRWAPERDALGRVTQPARIWVTSPTRTALAPESASAVLPLPARFIAQARNGDEVVFTDTRGLRRSLLVFSEGRQSLWASCERASYVVPRAPVQLVRGGRVVAKAVVGRVPPAEEPILLKPADTLVVTREQKPGHAARRNNAGVLTAPARIPCTLPQVFKDVKAGERIFFDDGKIGGVIRAAEAHELRVEITQAAGAGSRLRSDKGINLPDSELRLEPLTSKDLDDLSFAAKHADLVGYSFVRRPEDVYRLEDELAARGGGSHIGIMLKIENRMAFENLPELLLAGLQSPPLGVMVARGDLGVELGFDRLAEVQEEILWLAEAAHVPVIWATQVLERMAKKGMPSRAEVTDAAMSGRAECVMLNKGPHVVSVVQFLDNILRRMQDHQEKKRAILRKLSVSHISPRKPANPE